MSANSKGLKQLAEAVSGLKERIAEKEVAPPVPFVGLGEIECFFKRFEEYAEYRFGTHYASYLNTLPEFLQGEALKLLKEVNTCSGVTYWQIKTHLIEAFNKKKNSIVYSGFAQFMAVERAQNESLDFYCFRLKIAIDKFTEASCEARDIMVYSRLLAALPGHVIKQLNILRAVHGELSLDTVINVATVMEESAVKSAGDDRDAQDANLGVQQESVENGDQCATHAVTTVMPAKVRCTKIFRRSSRFNGRCFHCGRNGHTSRRCYKRRLTPHCGTVMHRKVACSAGFGNVPAQLGEAIGSWEVSSDGTSDSDDGFAHQSKWEESMVGSLFESPSGTEAGVH